MGLVARPVARLAAQKLSTEDETLFFEKMKRERETPRKTHLQH